MEEKVTRIGRKPGSDGWRERAACKGIDTNLFFPAVGDGATVRQALAVCNGDEMAAPCPVRDECQKFVLSFEQDEDVAGIFGGMTAGERKRIRKERRLEQTVTVAVPEERMPEGSDTFTRTLGQLLNLIHSVLCPS